MDDRALVEAAAAGSREAFDQLVGRYQTPIINLVRALTAGSTDAEDLALFGELLGEQVDDVHRAAAELSQRIRSGELDDRIDELAPRLTEHVRRKLEIARPGYEEG